MTKKSEKRYEPKVKLLKTNFGDMQTGQLMAIGTPQLITQLVKLIPKGHDCSLSELRMKLAKHLKADVACPVTTSMYLRIAIEAEVSDEKQGDASPFWRVVSPQSPLFRKLPPAIQSKIISRRESEGIS